MEKAMNAWLYLAQVHESYGRMLHAECALSMAVMCERIQIERGCK